jgi:hypothetical protein
LKPDDLESLTEQVMLYHKDYFQDKVTHLQLKQLIVSITHKEQAKPIEKPKKKAGLKKSKTSGSNTLSSLDDEPDSSWGR